MDAEGSGQAYLVPFLFVVLVLVLASNVATMIFARTVTREHEIAMRFALGATRARVLGQFFIEALVLALAAAGAGLLIVSWGAGRVTRLVWDVTDGRTPFWLEATDTLNATTIAYALLIAVIAALVAGVMPAMKVTRSRQHAALRHAPGSGNTNLHFGGVWSAMIVIQVAFAVLILPPAIVAIGGLFEPDHADPGFASEQFLSARLEMEPAAAQRNSAGDLPFDRALRELRRRLESDPRVAGVTFANRLPGMSHPDASVVVDLDGAPGGLDEMPTISSVAPDFFATFGAPLVAGRTFTDAEAATNAAVAIVNEDFVGEALGGRNAIGQRVRYAGGETWYQIVGVVKNLGMDTTRDAFTDGKGPGIYHPLSATALRRGDEFAARVAIHLRGDAQAYASALRDHAAAVAPGMRVYDVLTLDRPVDRVSRAQRRIGRFFTWTTALVALVALLISVAGIYALLSFTVARQTRDIGIRIALGADPRRIVGAVFSRAMIQFAIGITIGAVTWFYVIVQLLGGGDRIMLLAATTGGLLLLGVIACGLPVRRALRIAPTEALRTLG